MGSPALARIARRMQKRPFASLVLCVVLAAVQLCTWPILFLVAMRFHRDQTVMALLQVPAVLWMLLPAGAIYGLWLALRPGSGEHGAAPRVLGLIANGLYLLFGIFIWLIVLSGVRV